jgi:hypothetical protein
MRCTLSPLTHSQPIESKALAIHEVPVHHIDLGVTAGEYIRAHMYAQINVNGIPLAAVTHTNSHSTYVSESIRFLIV